MGRSSCTCKGVAKALANADIEYVGGGIALREEEMSI
jgi:hypothetical protein